MATQLAVTVHYRIDQLHDGGCQPSVVVEIWNEHLSGEPEGRVDPGSECGCVSEGKQAGSADLSHQPAEAFQQLPRSRTAFVNPFGYEPD